MKKFNSNTALINQFAEKALFIAASAMMVFFLSFVWIAIGASKATAQSAAICKGANLIQQYAENTPDKLVEIKAEAAKIINGKSIFWKIEKDGIAPSWMLGTMHLADERIANLDGKKLAAFNQADTVIIESTDASDPAKAQAAMAKLTHLTFLPPGQDLAKLLDAQTLEKLRPAVEQRGIPFAIATKLKPWLVATTIALPLCEMAAKQSGKAVLDTLIAQEAIANGKKLVGLETIEEQFNAIASLPQEFHLTALKETLDLGNEVEDIIETMKQLYLTGNIGMVMPMMKVASPKTDAAGGNQKFQEQLIIQRNITMAERSAELLKNGNVFLAVGALHLPDETGLVKLLRDQGYKVTAN